MVLSGQSSCAGTASLAKALQAYLGVQVVDGDVLLVRLYKVYSLLLGFGPRLDSLHLQGVKVRA